MYLTFQDDWVAFRVADLMNVERLMWANDFPHSDATWPDSQALLAEHAQHLSAARARPHPARNAADLYGITALATWTSTRCIAAGVYDPDAPGAAERLELLQWLLDQGVSLDADRRRGPARLALPGRPRRAALAGRRRG